MTDYQTVRVVQKRGRVLTLEVEEDNPDVSAFSAIMVDGALRGGPDVTKVVAILLLDERARSGKVVRPDEVAPRPELFIADARLVSVVQIGEDHDGNPRYRARLAVTVTEDAYARVFEEGETWGAAADLGVDFSDLFF